MGASADGVAEDCGGSDAEELRGPKKELELGYGSHIIKDEEENGEGTEEDCGSSELDERPATDEPWIAEDAGAAPDDAGSVPDERLCEDSDEG
jgi:hypothetical protein